MLDVELSRQWEEHEARGTDRPYKTCEVCGSRIYEEDDTYDGDEYYEVDDIIICEDCFFEWARDNLRRRA